MKKLLLVVLAICILPLPSFAETKEGTCKLKEGNGNDAFIVEVGTGIKGTCKFYISDFFGKKIIIAGIKIENTTKKPMHCQYNVAFFDKDGNFSEREIKFLE